MKNKFFIVLTIALSFTWASKVSAYDKNKVNEDCAIALNSLGLFRGDGKSFNLDASLKRSEAAVMVTRLMGAESQAVSENLSSPFEDVPDWASAYVGWLYQNKLIYGIDSTTYGSEQNISGEEYMTILLRCLGYSDAEGGDFKFSEVYTFADKVFDPLTTYCLRTPDTNTFVRYDCTYLTVKSLFCNMKGSSTLLSDNLISEKAFTREAYEEAVKVLIENTSYVSYQLNEDGNIIPYFEEIPVNNLNKSEIKFASIESYTEDNLIVKGLDGKNYLVDKYNLKPITEAPAEDAGYVAGTYQSPNGTIYYVKQKANIDGDEMTVTSIDSNGNATEIVRFDSIRMYTQSYGENYPDADETMFYILGKRGRVTEYFHIDTKSGEVTKIPIENSEYIDLCFIEDKILVLASDGETKSLYLIKDDKLLDTTKLNTRVAVPSIYFDRQNSTSADDETFYLIEDNKILVLADFGRDVRHTFKNSQGYYIISNAAVGYSGNYDELGLIDNQGNYSPVITNEILDEYQYHTGFDLTQSNDDFIFYLIGDVYQGLGYEFTYKYDIKTKEITVTDFVSNMESSSWDRDENIKAEQERIDNIIRK